ncbi:LysR family transcriptional regulator [Epibacterium ulvae]|uniref:LysR family transcriptional regulator n=1 Tax=Epibacterium ulvae TaxID=1156985 RepID=UPI001BFBFF61|nr:LysR family transcriptional regulator [Epibacterium ulvae]MBT8154202.1 LysR family transcriptional regulator [Epibacterium ulvae]
MDWGNLQVLAVLSREGSLAGAARALGVNHATISRRLAALEADVGHSLVRRLARSTPLTEKGQDIATLALAMEAQTYKIDRLVNLAQDTVTGTVRISAPPAFLSETFIPELTDIAEAHPDLQLNLMSDTQVASLDHGHADIAVRLVEPTSKQNITRKLGTITYSLYGAPNYFDRAQDSWRFIGFDRGLTQTPQQTWLEDYAAGRVFQITSNNIYTHIAAAEAGLGLALLPDRIAGQSKQLQRLPEPSPLSRTAWMVLHHDVASLPAVRLVADAILRSFQRTP